jgi:hypothetical protein
MRFKMAAGAALCFSLATACHKTGPGGPTRPIDAQLTLAPGQSAMVADSSLRIAFVGVSGDSRCPADALCIQGGDAVVQIRVVNGAPARYELHTGDTSRSAVSHAGYRIALTELQPYPFSSRPIAPADYRATLRVTR